MHLAISLLNFRPGKIGGAETYLRKMIPQLVEQRGGDRVTLVAYHDHADEIAPPGADVCVVPAGEREITRKRALEAMTPYRALSIERQFAALNADVLFFPQQSLFPKRVRGRLALTILDFQHIELPQNFGLADRIFRAGIYGYSLKRADHFIAISDYTRRQLQKLHPVPDEKTTVALLGCELAAPPQTSAVVDVPRPYAYYPAATHPHKNHLQLFECIAQLSRRNAFPYHLVLSGLKTPHWRRLQASIESLGLRDAVIHVGFVPYQQVQALYQGAEAILFPTTYEGFGLPLVEGVMAGRKVIASRLEIFRELGFPDEWAIDFGDPEQLRAALERSGPTILQRPLPTWQQCAAATWQGLRRCAAT